MNRHKVFLSHYNEDAEEVKKFVEYFDEEKEVFISKVVGDDYDTTINSDDSDYIMKKIREDYLTDSTVTIVLIGKNTHKRKYVDWEIASTIRNDTNNKRSGLIGILLPGRTKENTTIPPRLQDNVDCGYAEIRSYPSYSPDTLRNWIEDAFQRKDDDDYTVDNSRKLFSYNRS